MTSPLFEPSKAYRPFAYPWAVDITVEHERMHWTEEEVDLADDVADWKTGKLTIAEKNFVTQILRMFTQSDVNVGTFYTDYLMPKIKNNQVRGMLRGFANREDTHQRAYALLNDTLGLPEGDYLAFLDYREMAEKSEFMLDADPHSEDGFALTLAKSVFNEGISLFASFVMLLNFQRRGLMKGMGKVVEWSVKDETKHVEGIARIFRTYTSDAPHIVNDAFKKKIYDMARTAVQLEDAFIDLAYAMGPVEGLSADEVKAYIRFITDRRLTQIGLKPNYEIENNPLPWVDIILNAPDLTNFFENKVAEYEVGSLVGGWVYDDAEMRVYSRSGCPYCDKAKALLDEIGLRYQEVDLSDNVARQAFYDERGFVDGPEGTQRTVPKIYALENGEERLIGGYVALAALLGVNTEEA